MTKSSRHPVAYHRVSHGLAHHKTRPGCLGRPWRVRGQCVYDETTLTGPRAATHDDTKVLTAPHTRGSRQHGAPRRRPNQADSVSRPLRRRAPKMARPARVRMRRRNPWVRARRRLFGWKVRLPLLTAQNLLVSTSSRLVVRRVVLTHGSLWRLLPTCGLVTSSDDKQGHTKLTHCRRETLRGYAPASGSAKPAPRPQTATGSPRPGPATLQHQLATRRGP
jgi:hypothetical protein